MSGSGGSQLRYPHPADTTSPFGSCSWLPDGRIEGRPGAKRLGLRASDRVWRVR